MVATYLDVTDAFNADNGYVQDVSGWDYAVWQFVNPSGTIDIKATNDGRAVEGRTDGNSSLATNFQTVQATLLTDGTSVTSVSAAGLYKTTVVGRYVKFGGSGATADAVIIQLAKIH